MSFHVPLLRAGRPYRSLNTAVLRRVGDGAVVAEVSQANRGLIARDLGALARQRRPLQERTVAELVAVCRRAGELFATAELPVDPIDGVMQTPDDYVAQLSATTGMPRALCRANMDKIRFTLVEMERVLGGLTRGLDLAALDVGYSTRDGRTVSYRSETDALGAILPSNSPGVHTLWLPAVALKSPVVLKPGSQEPWSPLRVAQALVAAGAPPEAVSFYPTDYAGAAEILLRCGRSMLFGDVKTVGSWAGDPRIQLHGPGWSKVLLGADAAPRWAEQLDLIETSVCANGGRSCLNASGVWTPAHGRELAEALAERLANIEARPLDDPEARLAAFVVPEVAHRISALVDQQLERFGAEDLTARYRSGGRLVERDGLTFLLPTVVWCSDPEHPLASTELLFPFASVVECAQETMLERIGPTLVATAITGAADFRAELLHARHVDRLNLGAIPTTVLSWDQPHEGNLFEHLYRQRAFQAPGLERAAAAGA